MGEPQKGHRYLKLPRQSQVFFYLLLALMLFLTWLVFRPFVIFMIAGVFVAVLALPIDRLWEKILGTNRAKTRRRSKRRNRVAAALTILTLFILVTIPLVLLGFALAKDAIAAAQAVQGGAIDDIVDRGVEIVFPNQTPEERNATIGRIQAEMEPRIEAALQSLGNRLVNFVGDFFIAVTIILFVVYYILTDGDRLLSYIRRAAPLPTAQVDYLLHEAKRGLDAVFVGQILTSLIQGGLGGVGFFVAGLPNPVLWAVIMAILSLLPVVGAFLVWVPAAIFLLLTGHTWQGVFLIIWGVVVVSQIDNFLRPKLIGNRAQIHPVFILVGVLGGVTAFGFIGLFLGPLLVGVTISVLRVWESDYLHPDLTLDQARPRPIWEFETEHDDAAVEGKGHEGHVAPGDEKEDGDGSGQEEPSPQEQNGVDRAPGFGGQAEDEDVKDER